MHQLYIPFTVRWLSVMSGAAHATTVLRAMARQAPPLASEDAPPDDSEAAAAPPVPANTGSMPSSRWPMSA